MGNCNHTITWLILNTNSIQMGPSVPKTQETSVLYVLQAVIGIQLTPFVVHFLSTAWHYVNVYLLD